MPLPSNLRVSNNSYLRVPHSEDFNFGSGDFTIEFWIKFNSWANDRAVLTKGWPSSGAAAFFIYVHNNSRMAFYSSSNGGNWDIADSVTIATGLVINTWYHVAITRSGSTLRTFINGSLTSSWNNGAALVNNVSKSLTIGNGDTGQHPIDGWIDGLRISKGVARYTSGFVPSPLDPATTSSFDDSSRFNKPVGNKGPTIVSSAQSQFGGSSGYFNGSSYLSVPGDKAWQFGTNDFTVEGWINPNEISSTIQSIVGNYDGADGGWRLGVKAGLSEPPTALLLHFNGNNGSTNIIDSSTNKESISTNGSVQISTTQNMFGGSSLKLGGTSDYLDGLSGVDLSSGSYTVEFWFLAEQNNAGDNYSILNGNYSSLPYRWTLDIGVGSNKIYPRFITEWNSTVMNGEAAYTLGSWAHIAYVNNIATNNLAIYINGVKVTERSAVNLTKYSTMQIGRNSGNYQNVGPYYIDELRISPIAVYTANFTPPSSALPDPASNNSVIQFRNGNSSIIEKTVTPPLSAGTWYHIAASRNNNDLKLFVDGNLLGSGSGFTADLNRINTNGLTIGSSRSSSNVVSDAYKGYIDDLRITKGVARYTASFARPAAPAPALGPAPIAPNSPTGLAVTERDNIFKVSLTPPSFDGRSPITSYNFQYSTDGSTWNNVSSVSDPHYDKVSLLLPMTGSNNSFNIFDDSKYNHNVSIVGDTKISTAQSWFNNGSAVFDGSVDNLVIENNTAFDLRNQDWTIEGWIRPTGNWSKYNTIISKRGNGGSEGTDSDWQLYLRQSNGVLSFYSATPGGQQESGSAPYINVWNHVAAVRNGRTITLYLNGISVLSFLAETAYTTNRKVYVGGWPAGNEYFYGHMNDIRVTKGVARYTSNFDPRLLTQAPANRVTGLSTVGTPYTFRARAVNSIGSSQYSTSTSSAIATLSAPTNLNVIPDSDKAYLSWTAPSANNSAIRDYSVQYSSDNGNTWTDYIHNASISTSIVVDGLTIGTSYSFRVAAVNMAGIGTYVSSASPVLTALRQDNTYNKTRLLLHLDSN